MQLLFKRIKIVKVWERLRDWYRLEKNKEAQQLNEMWDPGTEGHQGKKGLKFKQGLCLVNIINISIINDNYSVVLLTLG